MQCHQFEQLDFDSKLCSTWKYGVLIAHRTEEKHYMSLYRLDDFYIELHYNTCFDGVAGIKTFICEEELQPYLEQINLSGLW